MIIRNCIIRDSHNGVITSPTTLNLTVEGCYLWGNGRASATTEHNMYSETRGILVQYNHFGPPLSTSSALSFKDRSAGTVCRYNWIEDGSRQLDLVDATTTDIINDSRYGHDFVYGNVLYEKTAFVNNQIVHYGGDSGTTANYRPGPLHFYNNTVVSLRTDGTAIFRPQDDEVIECYNNVVYTPNGGLQVNAVTNGTVTYYYNWLQTGYSGTGATDGGNNITGTAPGFVDFANEDFHITSTSACRDAAMALPSAVLPDNNVTMQYVKHQAGETRPSDGTFDIGAYEFDAGVQDLVITTTSLPSGNVGVAYSQTLAAGGGVTPYSWSVVSGSLPAGLSLGSSTGTISGTPTAANTYNFTVRVTDNQAPADTDDQALSITTSVVTEPTYRFVAADAETATSSTTYVNKATLAFTPAVADDWIILGFAEFRPLSSSYSGLVRMTVDGVDAGEVSMEPTTNNEWLAFSAMKVASLSAAAHTINIDYCSENNRNNNYTRRARIVAIRKASLEQTTAAADTSANLTTTLTNYVTANFTPASTGSYLLIYSGEFLGATSSYSTQLQARLNGNVLDEVFVAAKDATDWSPFISFSVAELGASAQTVTIAAAKETGSTATHSIRRARVAAIRLTGGRFAAFQSAASDGESTTTSASYVEKLTKSWSVGTTADWAILASMRLANSSTSYQTYGQVQLDNTTVLSETVLRPQDTTDSINASAIDVRELTAGTRQVDTDYKSSSTSATAKIKYAHIVLLPIE